MADEELERPATWENVVVGKVEEVVGKLTGKDDLVREGEAEVEAAHEVRTHYDNQDDPPR